MSKTQTVGSTKADTAVATEAARRKRVGAARATASSNRETAVAARDVLASRMQTFAGRRGAEREALAAATGTSDTHENLAASLAGRRRSEGSGGRGERLEGSVETWLRTAGSCDRATGSRGAAAGSWGGTPEPERDGRKLRTGGWQAGGPRRNRNGTAGSGDGGPEPRRRAGNRDETAVAAAGPPAEARLPVKDVTSKGNIKAR